MIKIKQFQLQYGLVADGVIGKKTLNKIKQVLNIPSNQALAHFWTSCTRTANFNLDTENLNYSAAGLVSTFKNIFQHQNLQLVMLDNKIANKVYANRMGNGDEKVVNHQNLLVVVHYN
jgi:putative chitinase